MFIPSLLMALSNKDDDITNGNDSDEDNDKDKGGRTEDSSALDHPTTKYFLYKTVIMKLRPRRKEVNVTQVGSLRRRSRRK